MGGASTLSGLGTILTPTAATAICLTTACVSTTVFPSSTADITDGTDVAASWHGKLENAWWGICTHSGWECVRSWLRVWERGWEHALAGDWSFVSENRTETGVSLARIGRMETGVS